MSGSNRKGIVVCVAAGATIISLAAVLTGQEASKPVPVKSETQYFVTADGDTAHLWVREGTALRVVGHGECKDCPQGKHEGHDHK